ncbi:uncharacterized protein LOC120840572 [Ixodes scapularis]|uniref:uncharacterized protein LOC120840572 n=1 Tax=Ixodes scapularis TaxID=6945 RepID=UPI001A9F83C8|nr:uncharacterized protein LOC120840572 [Ixodes scapularis]
MEYCYSLGQVFQSDGKLISPEELKQKEENMRNKALKSFDNAACLKLNECKEKERESLIKQLEMIFSDVWKRYQDVRKNEGSKKLQHDLKLASEALRAIGQAGLFVVASIPMPVIPMAAVAITSIAANLASLGTEAAAAITNRQNEKDSADAAGELPTDLEKKQS